MRFIESNEIGYLGSSSESPRMRFIESNEIGYLGSSSESPRMRFIESMKLDTWAVQVSHRECGL